MIVLGGTWDFYPRDYKIDFVKKLYDACNSFSQLQIESTVGTSEWKYGFKILNEDEVQLSNSLSEAITINETAENRIIGLTIETTPLFATRQNCKERREMGVTRIEMGVQSTNNTVLDLNQRDHHIQEVRKALHRMRQFGFKISIHIMPGLYGSDPEMDIQTFRDIYSDPWLQPDEIKFYPTSVIPNTELYTLYLQGKYQPIMTEEISHII
ncbi:MAG: radical SAM protein, partial [candidate division SR1 bacterium]|nr:radical SAM protein [candidate division SR1 bacterium]